MREVFRSEGSQRGGPRRFPSLAAAAALVLGVQMVGAGTAGAATTSFTWSGAGTTTSAWSSTANWTGGTAPTGSVGTLTFPDLGSTCDQLPPPTSPVCYRSDNDVSGISANSVDFSSPGGSYVLSGAALAVGSGGLTVTAPTSGSSSENLGMPLTLGAA
ncbi:MAG: hypothetical protein ACRDWW_07175, partial [Acidimicrobiales bacterium]